MNINKERVNDVKHINNVICMFDRISDQYLSAIKIYKGDNLKKLQIRFYRDFFRSLCRYVDYQYLRLGHTEKEIIYYSNGKKKEEKYWFAGEVFEKTEYSEEGKIIKQKNWVINICELGYGNFWDRDRRKLD